MVARRVSGTKRRRPCQETLSGLFVHCQGAHTSVLCHRLLGWSVLTAPVARGLRERAMPGWGRWCHVTSRPEMDGRWMAVGSLLEAGWQAQGVLGRSEWRQVRRRAPVPRESLLPRCLRRAVSDRPRETAARSPAGARTRRPSLQPSVCGVRFTRFSIKSRFV